MSESLFTAEAQDLGLRFRVPRKRIASFKEYMIHRLTRGMEYHDFWALQGVDLQVRPGEVLGVVGRNGAGKSSLLKVLAQVLRPTTGRIVTRGRVSTLLELGAGFHPDMTGKENVFIQASMLGYPIAHVREHLDSVFEFAELDSFRDVPVRTYSAGMLARLGFSVATLFRPDLLLIDEVLAVGDMAFQEKCAHRFRAYQSAGTAVILVSHSVTAIRQHCSRALWLEGGRVAAMGDVSKVVERYSEAMLPGGEAGR